MDQTSRTFRKNHVISPDSTWGPTLLADCTVKVYVSSGQQQVTVPNVVGEDENAAQTKLTNLNLNPVIKTDSASTAAAGTVVKQSPTGGKTVNPGSTVT